MTDFSTTNIHCSSISNIINGGKTLTPKQKYERSVGFVTYWQAKYDAIEENKRSQKNAINTLAKLDFHKKSVIELEPFKNDEPLSKGAMSHLKKVYGYAKYGKWCAIADKGTKYTNKGTLAEQTSIELASRVRGAGLVKNEERVNNEFLTGIPDIFLGESIYNAEYIIDIKTSWDIETFLDNLGKPLDNQYWWQIQGYLAITGAKIGEVAYCLVNTPESILNGEKYRLKERMEAVTELDPKYVLAEKQLINNMTFDDIPESERIIRFIVERDDEAIEKVYKKVVQCREYLSEIEKMHLQGIFLAKEPVEEEVSEEISGEAE